MSQTPAQLQQELQNELSTANQLLRLISVELQQIAHFTNQGGDFEANIKQNASLMKTLADMQQIDLNNIPPFTRKHIDMSMDVSQNAYEEHNTFREDSQMEDSQ